MSEKTRRLATSLAGLSMSLVLFAACVLALCSLPAHANDSAPGSDSAPAGDKADDAKQPAQEYTVLQQRPDRLIVELPNRMIVAVQRMPAAPVVSAQIWVKTGSLYEQEHVGAGLSHFLEHLISGGTTSTRNEEQSNAILGAIGGQTNAATSLDTVHYYINTTADNAEADINLLSDWLANAQITPAEYARERDVIQREFDMGQGDPNRIFWKLTMQARYPAAHPAQHPTIGYIDEFLSISRDGIYDFYRRMYVPNNMVMTVAGDIDPQKTVDQIAGIWGKIPTGELPKLSLPSDAPDTLPATVQTKADIKRPRVRMIWPGTKMTGEHDYALDVLGIILGAGESSRLTRSLRDQQQLVTSVDAFNLSFPWDKGFFAIQADVADSPVQAPDASPEQVQQMRIDAVKKAIEQQVQQVIDHGVTDAELARARRMVIASVLQSSQTADGVATRLARDIIQTQDPDYLQRYAEAINKITAAEVQTAAKDFLQPKRLIVAELLPLAPGEKVEVQTRAPGSEKSNVSKDNHKASDANTSKDGGEEHFSAPTGAAPTGTPVNLDNAPIIAAMQKNIADSTARTVAIDEPQVFKLDNGLRVVIQKSTLVPAVSMQAYTLGGLLGDPAGKEGYSFAMAAMLTRGTSSLTADQLNEQIDALGADLGANSGNNTWYVNASCLSEDFKTVYQLMADVMLHPAFSADQWQRLQPRLLAAIDQQDARWSGELGRNFRENFFKGHPWSQTPMGQRDVVAALNRDDLAAFHKSQLDPREMVIAIAGDVDPQEALKLTTQLFGGLQAPDESTFNPVQPPLPAARIVMVKSQKPTTAVQIGFGPGIDRTSKDYPAVQVLSRVLSNFPSGYLDRALRGEGKGLAYATWSYPRVGIVQGSYEIVFNTSAPDALEAVKQAMNVVDRVKAGDIDAAALQRAKARLLTDEMMNKQSNSDRAAEYALDELYGVHQSLDEYLAAVNAVTVDDVKRVADQYLVNPVVVIMSDTDIDPTPVKPLVK